MIRVSQKVKIYDSKNRRTLNVIRLKFKKDQCNISSFLIQNIKLLKGLH